MSFSRPIQWYHSQADLIWPDRTFNLFVILVFDHKRDLTLRKAQELLEELVVGVDNDGEGGDQVEHQQNLHCNFHLK